MATAIIPAPRIQFGTPMREFAPLTHASRHEEDDQDHARGEYSSCSRRRHNIFRFV